MWWRLRESNSRPRVNLIRYYGVFAPNSRFRARVTPAERGKMEYCRRRGTDGRWR